MSPTSKAALAEIEAMAATGNLLQAVVPAITFFQLAPMPGSAPSRNFLRRIIDTIIDAEEDVEEVVTTDWSLNSETAARVPEYIRGQLDVIAARAEHALKSEQQTEQIRAEIEYWGEVRQRLARGEQMTLPRPRQ